MAINNQYLCPTFLECVEEFWIRTQQNGETFADFARALRALAQPCQFGVLLEIYLVYRFALGLLNKEVMRRIIRFNPSNLQAALQIAELTKYKI